MEYLMAEFLIIFIVALLFGFNFFKYRYDYSCSNKNSIVELNDKNWIINNEFVSLEEDTSLLRMKQKREDDRHYQDYERRRLSYDRNIITDECIKTRQFIVNHKGILEKVTKTELEQYAALYNKYLFKCGKLREDMFLTAKEFVIKEQNYMFIISFNIFMPMSTVGPYMIYNEKTARYLNGNINELFKKEFEKKWY